MINKNSWRFWIHLLILFIIMIFMYPLSTAALDNYEFDNTYQNSTIILTNGTEQFHTFENLTGNGTGDLDWVNFTTVSGYYYLIETKNYSDINLADTFIYLYASDGTTLLQQNDDIQSGVDRISRIVWFATSSGPFYIKIKHFDSSIVGGNYSISVEQQGRLVLSVVYPAQDINVTKWEFFNVSASLNCEGGKCYNVSFTLDPEPLDVPQEILGKKEEVRVFDRKRIDKILEREGEIDLIVKFKDEEQTRTKGIFARGSTEERFISSERKFRVKRRHRLFNGMSGNIDREGFDRLLLNEDIEAIYYDRPMVVSLSQSVPYINATSVWEVQINGTNLTGVGQTVCVLDTGINYNHSDFGGANGFPSLKVIGGFDFINNDSDPYDDHGHGSHVAGIIASEDSVYKGVAPDSKIVAVKVMGSDGSGVSSDIISGIEFCVTNRLVYNISIISMSLGDDGFGTNLPCDYDSLASSINAAVDVGIVVISSSGNENRGNTALPGLTTPACITNSISVGATGRTDDTIQGFTNRDWFLDVLAPGGSITATDWAGTHTSKSGTSMAAPHISGVIALIQQYSRLKFNRTLTFTDVLNRIKLFGVEVQDSSTPFSFTRVDALEAVVQKGVIPNVMGATPFYTNGSNPVDCGTLSSGENCSVTWWVNATGDVNEVFDFFVFGTATYSAIANSSHFNVGIVDDVNPSVVDLVPVANSTFNVSDIIEIGVNVTDNVAVDTVLANVTLPNGTLIQLTLLNFVADKYNSSFVIPNLTGQYNITVIANDTSNNINSTETTFFVGNDTVEPVFVSITGISSVIINGTNVTIDANVSDDVQVDSIWANVTLPDNSSQFISSGNLPYVFTNTSLIGIYNVTFYANDSSGNLINDTRTFEAVAPIEVTINVDITIGVSNTTVYISDTNESLNSTNKSLISFILPNVPVDIGFSELFDSRLETTLKGVNLSENLNGSIEFGNVSVSGFLTVYGISATFNFTSAEVIVSYANASFGIEDDLQLQKCDSFTISTGTCSSGFNDITSSAVQDQVNDKFIYNATSFSGFGIIEVTPDDDGGGGGGGGGSSKSVSVSSPNGGETWAPSSSHDITWSSSGVDHFEIYYSTNSGSSWILLQAHPYGTSSTTSYSWTLPSSESGTMRVRVDGHNEFHVVKATDSSNSDFSISSTSSSTGGGSGGGGSGSVSEATTAVPTSWTKTYEENDKELSEKISVIKTLGEKERVNVKIDGKIHSVGVVTLTNKSAFIEVASELQQVTLEIGEEKKFEVTNDSYYDLLVRLDSIVNGKAVITLSYIHEIFSGPSELFDISFNLDDSVIKGAGDLSSIVTFESFGTVPTPVHLTFVILDEFGNEVYREESDVIVTTEEVLRWDYDSIEILSEGKYIAVLETLYNVDVSDEFRSEFEIGIEIGIERKEIGLWVWIVVVVLGVLVVSWLEVIKRRRGIKDGRKRVKKNGRRMGQKNRLRGGEKMRGKRDQKKIANRGRKKRSK